MTTSAVTAVTTASGASTAGATATVTAASGASAAGATATVATSAAVAAAIPGVHAGVTAEVIRHQYRGCREDSANCQSQQTFL
ncbi:hypothetical protein FQZ97_918640 [compost metagenome]